MAAAIAVTMVLPIAQQFGHLVHQFALHRDTLFESVFGPVAAPVVHALVITVNFFAGFALFVLLIGMVMLLTLEDPEKHPSADRVARFTVHGLRWCAAGTGVLAAIPVAANLADGEFGAALATDALASSWAFLVLLPLWAALVVWARTTAASVVSDDGNP
ncbi:MAG: hypothetical protein JRJ84_07820 [Deltaproteobacteria bacterium]|nr:hypothetical protein [Deltaproteobacteria bacterium]